MVDRNWQGEQGGTYRGRRPFRRTGYGQYVRNYTFEDAYSSGSPDPDLDRIGYDESDRTPSRGLNRGWERQVEPGLDRYGVGWEDNKDWNVPGPYTGVGPRNYQRSDERIREDVCVRLTRHGQLDASQIEVEVQQGEVTLNGKVNSRAAKRMAEEAIEILPGVVDVHNRLRWQQVSTLADGEAPGGG